jgi:hypothetical protein
MLRFGNMRKPIGFGKRGGENGGVFDGFRVELAFRQRQGEAAWGA